MRSSISQTMSFKITPYIALAFLFSFIIVGLFYWTLPYSDATLPNALFTPALFIIVVSGILLQCFTEASFTINLNITAAVIPSVVMSRVIFDVFTDPSSHNLWPFELVIAVVVGYAVALPSVLIGFLFQRFSVNTPG